MKINIKTLFFTFFAILLISINAMADNYYIHDNYIGSDPIGSNYDGKDIVGTSESFDVHGISLDIDRNKHEISINILSNYFDNIGQYFTELGDLFISSDGYNPQQPSSADNMNNGEDWEYAVVLNEHLANGGTFKLYEVIDENIITSYAPNNYIYRQYQEVQYKPGDNQSYLTSGNWFINSDLTTLSLVMAMPNDLWNKTIGFHWTMTCANDVIEGSVESPPHAPEPATMFLVGSGLLGLAGIRKRVSRGKSQS